MNWYKHDTDATQDAKIRKLIIRYGPTGYAIYFHCLELIASEISESNLTFELEHDSEIIADNLHVKGTADQSGVQIVEEIMRYIIELNLFQENNGRVFCFKLLKRLDLSMTSNAKFREMITLAKENHDAVMTPSCKPYKPYKPKEKKEEFGSEDETSTPIKKESNRFLPPSLTEVIDYCKERLNSVDAQKFVDFYTAKGWLIGKNKMKDWRAAVRTWEKRDPNKGRINGTIADDYPCPICGKKIIGTTGLCSRCGWTKGDNINDPANKEFYAKRLKNER